MLISEHYQFQKLLFGEILVDEEYNRIKRTLVEYF